VINNCRGQPPGHHDQVPAWRCGHRLGHHDKVPAMHNGATARAPQSSTCDAQRAAPRAADWALRSNICDAPIKYLRGAAGNGLGTTIKYTRRTTTQRPERHNQVPVTHSERRREQRTGHLDQILLRNNERRRGKRSKPMLGITHVPLHHKRPAFALFAACLLRQITE
jgi:hypothetical protein